MKRLGRGVHNRYDGDALQGERLVLGVVRGESSAFIRTKEAMFKDKEVGKGDSRKVRGSSDL